MRGARCPLDDPARRLRSEGGRRREERRYLKPRAEIIPNEQDVIEITRRIDAARSIVIMCGAGCQGSGDDLRQLSDRLNAPLIHSVKGQDIMAYDDPHWMGGIGMIGRKAVYDAVMDCDLFLMLGTDYPYSESAPRAVTRAAWWPD
jgi:pyruvate dehydrogenase (quinone)